MSMSPPSVVHEGRHDVDIVALPEGGTCAACPEPIRPWKNDSDDVIWLNGKTYHPECYWGRKRVPS